MSHLFRKVQSVVWVQWFLIGGGTITVCPAVCWADAFDSYELVGTVSLPPGSGPFDALPDGRIIVLVDDDVWIETAALSGSFSLHGSLPLADIGSFGAAFLRVSPDGTRIAVGNDGGAIFPKSEVGVFDIDSLTGEWFAANHFDAKWVDDTQIALTAGDFGSPSVVTILDVASADPSNPSNPTVVVNIGGASGGITFDDAGRLFTGNGFGLIGPSGTGAVKAFEQTAWTTALSGGAPLDFEAEGTLVVDILSASPLGFDTEANLFVGGADVAPDSDSIALIRASAVAEALAGMGPVDPDDPARVRRLDPITTSANFYSVSYNPATRELYVRDFADLTLYVYREPITVPSVSQWGLVVLASLTLTAGTIVIRNRHVFDITKAGSTCRQAV